MILLKHRYKWKHHGLKPWRNRMPVALIFIFIFNLLPFFVQAAQDKQKVLIIYQQTQGFSQQLIEDLENDISNKGYQTLKMSIDADKKFSHANLLILREQQLLISIGSRTTELILKTNINKPILSALIPRHIAITLHHTYTENENWSCLLIDQPIDRQLKLITAVLGEHKNTGVILGPFTKNLKEDLTVLSSFTENNINIEEITFPKNIINSVNNLSQKNDVLLTLPDPIIYNRNTIRGILLSAYRKKLPIIGFSKAYVKAGAIAAVYSKPAQISKQISSITDYFFKHKRFEKNRYFPDDFSVSLNINIARSLGIKLDSDKDIIKKIKMAEANR